MAELDPLQAHEKGVFLFGDFAFDTRTRNLSLRGKQLPLGGRAADILQVLLEMAGQTVPRAMIVDKVWGAPNITDSALRFQINVLRKHLSPEADARPFIRNVSRVGYVFTEKVDFLPETGAIASRYSIKDDALDQANRTRPKTLIGRQHDLEATVNAAHHHRFVTILAPGGFGKTTLALAVLETLRLEATVFWIDASTVRQNADIWASLAAQLPVSGTLQAPVDLVREVLRSSRGFVFFDCVDRCTDVLSAFDQDELCDLENLTVITTSRQPVNVRDEHIVRLDALTVPPPGLALKADDIVAYSALALFFDRGAAHLHGLVPNEKLLASVAEICRRLDGIPLAIEIACAHLSIFGVHDLDALLRENFEMMDLMPTDWPERHRTLSKMIGWSFDLLTGSQRRVLLEMSVFLGAASVEACLRVISSEDLPERDVIQAIAVLVGKNLIVKEDRDGKASFRLLDTTRAFCIDQMIKAGEWHQVQAKLGEFFIQEIQGQGLLEGDKEKAVNWFGSACPNLTNLSACLDWQFEMAESPALAVRLAAEAAPLYMQLSLLRDCETVAARALTYQGRVEQSEALWAALNAFYGAALLATNGPVDASKAAMEVAIQKTQDSRLSPTAILAYSGLYWLHIYRSEPDLADVCAETLRPSSKSDLQDDDDLIADNYNAMALQMRGNQLRAERELEDVVKRQALISLGRFMRIGTDPGLLSRVFLIKAQWLRGKVTTALDHYEAIRGPLEEPEHGLYHCWALNEVIIPLYCSLRDYDRARHACETLRKAVHQQSMTIRDVSSEAALHAINALSGNPNYPALTALRDKMDRNKFRMLIPWIDGIRAQMLGELGRNNEALDVIDQSISFCRTSNSRWWMPELYSIRCSLLWHDQSPEGQTSAAIAFQESHDCAEELGASALAIRNVLRVLERKASDRLNTVAIEAGRRLLASYPDDGDPMAEMVRNQVWS
ncbi:ATP-binding protein [Rhizobium sp. G187]|uniref:ATP-binding protein n=1 Tax=Rhizobium sp. G187 TaxID=3451352 RepID=UPI003EE5418A